MSRVIINTDLAPRPRESVSQSVRSGHLIFVSAVSPLDLDMNLAAGDFDVQFAQTIANLRAILKAAESGFEQIVQCTIILTRSSDWTRMNELYAELWSAGDFPARTAFEARLPHPDALLQMDCVAQLI